MLLWDPEGLGGQVWWSETLVDRNDKGKSKVHERWLFCSVVFIKWLKKWFFKRLCQSLDSSIVGEHKETKGVWSWLLRLHSSEAIQKLLVPTSNSKVANRMSKQQESLLPWELGGNQLSSPPARQSQVPGSGESPGCSWVGDTPFMFMTCSCHLLGCEVC